MPTPPITASLVYDLIACPHRVALDTFGDARERDEVSAFVQMLWDRGSKFEHTTMQKSVGDTPVLDLSSFDKDERERRTLTAMQDGVPLIYQGRIQADDLLGSPDLLRKEATGYVPIDIKSGNAEEGSDDDSEGTPKKHYAVQLALYVDILERLGLSGGRYGYIWDAQEREVLYDLMASQGKRSPSSLWSVYEDTRNTARAIVSKQQTTRPAYASSCKLCHWYSKCLKDLQARDDITLMPKLGRKLLDVISEQMPSMSDMAAADPEEYIDGKKTVFRGVGPDRLRTFCERARLIKAVDPKPYLKAPVELPNAELEIFFDIEADPMQDICYLHGFLERRNGEGGDERFVAFFADEATPDAERDAFRQAMDYVRRRPKAVIYYYSKYERTTYRKLQARYPDTCTPDEVEALFAPDRSVDLFGEVVEKATMWPTRDHSIKTLAKYLGFSWRDTNPSGAASIEWFQRWTESRDLAIKRRILDYNEDDCRATRVLLDGIRSLAMGPPKAGATPSLLRK